MSSSVDVDELVDEALESAALTADAAGIKLQADAPIGLTIRGDRMLLLTALNNLIVNAIAYSPENTMVSVSRRRTVTDGVPMVSIAVTVTNVNDLPPVITSDGGGASATVSVAENTTAVTTVVATDGDGTTPTYAITGGADAALFTIDANTGALAFLVAALVLIERSGIARPFGPSAPVGGCSLRQCDSANTVVL